MTKESIIKTIEKHLYLQTLQSGEMVNILDDIDLSEIADEIIDGIEILLAKIWDCKNEQDKIFLIIDNFSGVTPNALIEKYKKELGY